MGRALLTNLYRVTFRPTLFTVYEPLVELPGPEEVLSRLSLPFFFRNGRLYLLGEVEEEYLFKDGHPLKKLAPELTAPTAEELPTLFYSFVRALGLRKRFLLKRRRRIDRERLLYFLPEERFLGERLVLSVRSLVVRRKPVAQEPVRNGWVLNVEDGQLYYAEQAGPEGVKLTSGKLLDAWSAYELLGSAGRPSFKLVKSLRSFYASVLKHYGWSISKEEPVRVRVSYARRLVDASGRSSLAPEALLVRGKPFLKKKELSVRAVAVVQSSKALMHDRLFLRRLKGFFYAKGVRLKVNGPTVVKAETRPEARRALSPLLESFDEELLLAFLEPFNPPVERSKTLYEFIKRSCLKRGKPSQVVLTDSLKSKNFLKVLLSVYAQSLLKTGSHPFLLKEPLEAELFVGIEGRKPYLVKLFSAKGAFLGYRLAEELKELEPLLNGVKGRVVFHADGQLEDEELKQLAGLPVETEVLEITPVKGVFFSVKSSKGAFYELKPDGFLLSVSDRAAPLLVRRRRGTLPLSRHASFLLSLTLLSLPPSMPVTLKRAGFFRELLRELPSGDVPFWL
ncbi:MAG: hypothetical protein GXO03_02215 [Aquificae bacterium]|nr:hypothetical protein [Aquificota bacterium]